MKDLPVPDPGQPDQRSATRYLIWLARTQITTLLPAMILGIAWMAIPAVLPAAVGRAVDAAAARNPTALATAAGVVLLLGVAQAVGNIVRHRFAVTNFLTGAYRTVQVTVRHAVRLGATLNRRLATGEIVAIGTSDVTQIGGALDITSRGSGAVVAVVIVAVLLLRVSVPLGLVVVIGVPVLMAVVAALLRPLHQRNRAYRELTGELTNRAGDIVAGLRVLRGIGGEAAFAAKYRVRSQAVRDAGVAVGRIDALLKAAQVLLPGGFLVLVTWLGARSALAGEITPGQLVAFYGYTSFLVMPLRTLAETADRLTRGHVAARRVVRLLQVEPDVTEPDRPAPAPPTGGDLIDPDSGVRVEAGRFTAIASAEPADAVAIADRLGRYDPHSRATLGGVALADLPVATVRAAVLVADNDARLFNGPLGETLGLRREAPNSLGKTPGPQREALARALFTASAQDIVDALPDGLDTLVTERGREFSGGQQQRLRLVRALVADPAVLVLVEPTSAVDAHTEARIAERLTRHRCGRTTVICTTSPLVLDRVDHVCYVERGRVVAQGRHRDLLTGCAAYRSTVTRQEDA